MASHAPMTTIDIRDLLNHTDRFGYGAVVHKRGRTWWIDFRGFGFPCSFKTKNAAMERVAAWRGMLLTKLREEGMDRYGNRIEAGA